MLIEPDMASASAERKKRTIANDAMVFTTQGVMFKAKTP